MKKIAMLAISALALTASAQSSYVVWSGEELADGQVQIQPLEWQDWWDLAWDGNYADADAPGGKALRAYNNSDKATTTFSGGLMVLGANESVRAIGQGDYDLVFSVRSSYDLPFTIRLTGGNSGDQNWDLSFPKDDKWHEVRLPLSDHPAIADNWKALADGQVAFVFAVVGGDGNKAVPGAEILFHSIRYEAAIPMMSLTVEAADVTETSASIKVTTDVPEGYSDVQLLMDGEPVALPADGVIAIDGLDPATAYTRSFQLTGVYDGKTLASNPVEVKFSTKRPAGVNPVWYGHWEGATEDKTPFSVDYQITCNSDNTLTVEAVCDLVKDGLVYEINFQNGTDEWKAMTNENGVQTYTTVASFNDGDIVNFFFWIKYAGGVTRADISYTAGSENEKPIAVIRPELKAEAADITAESAVINWTVTLPAEIEGASVEVFMDDQAVAESPVALTGLDAATEYTRVFRAVATLDGETYESKEVKVTFKTLRGEATDLVYNGYADMTFPGSYLAGQDAASAMDHFFGVPYSVNFTAAGQIVVSADFSAAMSIVGIVPQAAVKGQYHNLDKVEGENIWTAVYDGDYDLDAAVEVFFYSPYAGGVCRSDVRDYKAGAVADPVVAGELDRIEIVLSKSYASVDVPVYAVVKALDAAGHFISADATLSGEGLKIEGNAVKVTEKGTYELTAEAAGKTATASILCVTSESASNLASGITPEISEFGQNPAAATDGNEGSELFFNCATTQEHTLTLDLGQLWDIEAVELVWEGASATHYTVTLDKVETPALRARAAAEAPHIFTVENGQGGAGVTARAYLYRDDMQPVTAQTVTVNTTKAFEPTWGIKLKQIRVFGTEPGTTGVEDIVVSDDTLVNVYTLTGVLLRSGVDKASATDNLPAGIYIVGARKVIVR